MTCHFGFYQMVSSLRRIYGELYVIKLGTEKNLRGTEMKLGTSEIHTSNEGQGSSMKGTKILSKTEVTGKLSPEIAIILGIEFTETTRESRVFNNFWGI